MEITRAAGPEPGPGAIVVSVTRANICGSDLHIWRGDGYLAAMGRDDGRIIGHEMTGGCTPSAPA
jgi:threonine dehydrogenase-like Zn-dependent dehydrogenase